MIGRFTCLVLGVVPLTGCGAHRSGGVDPAVLAEMTATVHDRAPVNDRPAAPVSPYNLRTLAPQYQEPAQPRVERASPEEPPPSPPKPTDIVPVSLPRAEVPTAPALVPEIPATPLPASKKPADGLVTAFEQFRRGKPAEGNAQLQKCDPAAREMLGMLLPLTARLTDLFKKGGPQDFATAIDTLDRLAQSLRPRAALTLEKMCFCRGIEKFGVYQPLPLEHAFQAAEEGRPGDLVQVYVELRNFACVATGPLHETALACTLEIHDGRKHVAWRQDRPAQVEQSRSPRRDAHLSCHFYVPPRLPPGDYTLWIHVKDVTGLSNEAIPPHRIARRSLPFHVRAAGVARNE